MNLNIVLVAPEIPQNTGAIGRLCVCLGARLHLIEPLGFELDESRVRRAGLDYWQHVDVATYPSWRQFRESVRPLRCFFASTKGITPYYNCQFRSGDYLVFGNESSGFPKDFYDDYREDLCQIPMPGDHARSLNLANAAAIIAYEALRQAVNQ